MGAEPDGISVFREPNGVMGFSIQRGDSSEVFLPKEENAEAEESDDDEEAFDADDLLLQRRVCPDDGEYHTLEIRFDKDTRALWLFLDGVEFARGVSNPARGKTVQAGFSGQAPLGTNYRIEVDRFEIRRVRPKGTERRRR